MFGATGVHRINITTILFPSGQVISSLHINISECSTNLLCNRKLCVLRTHLSNQDLRCLLDHFLSLTEQKVRFILYESSVHQTQAVAPGHCKILCIILQVEIMRRHIKSGRFLPIEMLELCLLVWFIVHLFGLVICC